MNAQSQVKIGIGANPIHRFPKKYTNTTTARFLQFGIANVMEMPKSSLHCNHTSFMRSFPLKRPLMTNLTIHKQAYFVPYRTIWEPWSDFRTDTPHNQPDGTSIIPNNPLIVISDLITLFCDDNYSTSTNIAPVDLKHGCDFMCTVQGEDRYYTFTDFGRWAYKLICSMGLPLPFASFLVLTKEDSVSALPFLAVAKVFIDYFFPNQYAHYGVYAIIDGIFQRQFTYYLSITELDTIFKAIYKVSYGSDYFVSAFDEPLMSANGVQSTDFHISDVSLDNSTLLDGQKGAVEQASNGTPVVHRAAIGQQYSDVNYVVNFSQYIDNQLKALTQYIRRHSLAGSRALTRYLADWGVTLSADKLKRCYKLGETIMPIQIGDVTSQSDTYNSAENSGAQLGDYAGRSVAFDASFDFDCETDEDGLLVITYSIVPDVSYVQGIQRYWFHKTKLDFLTGDFDGLTMREILQMELFVGTKREIDPSYLFAFSPIYAEYKIDYDVLSGDFCCDTKNLGLMGFESTRQFADELGLNTFNVVHGLDFVLAKDSDQYDRIFFNDNSDSFVLVHRAKFNHNMPAVPLYDNYDFEDARKHVLLEVNGAKDN